MNASNNHPVSLDQLQTTVGDWVVRAFGAAVASSQRERAARLLEESLELSQAAGLTEAEAIRLVRHVFTRPVGERDQEVGGVAVTLLAFCASAKVSLQDMAQREIDRVLSIPIEHFAKRNELKRAMGIVAE